MIPVYYTAVATSGTWNNIPLNSQTWGGVARSETVGGYKEWTVMLTPGTWRLLVAGRQYNSQEIYALNGVTVKTVGSGQSTSGGWLDEGTFTVTTNGRHTLRLTNNGGGGNNWMGMAAIMLVKES